MVFESGEPGLDAWFSGTLLVERVALLAVTHEVRHHTLTNIFRQPLERFHKNVRPLSRAQFAAEEDNERIFGNCQLFPRWFAQTVSCLLIALKGVGTDTVW